MTIPPALGRSVSYLFVPGSRPDRVEKARHNAADEIIIDLEDAVGPADKAMAREALVELPAGRPFYVRVNARGTPEHDADLRTVAGLPSVLGVVLPKVESSEDVAAVSSVLPVHLRLLALVETARGLVDAEGIASAGVSRIMFGFIDYLADIGAPYSRGALLYPRSRLVVASRAAGLPAPVDGPSLVIDDPTAVRSEAEEARELGMGGKLCIHPNQVPIVTQAFRPGDEERRWAESVLIEAESRGGGVFLFEGRMVDEPVLARARRILE